MTLSTSMGVHQTFFENTLTSRPFSLVKETQNTYRKKLDSIVQSS